MACFWYDIAGMSWCMSWCMAWFGLAGTVWYIVWPGGHAGYMVRPSGHGMWNGLVCMAWYMVWPGRDRMVYGQRYSWQACMVHGMVYGMV